MDYKVKIRSYTNEDIKVLLEMTSEEGWSLSEIDIGASLQVDPKGLLVADNEAGIPIGFIGLFNMSPNMTYVNVFVVRKDLRGKGIGKKLWTAMLKATKDNNLVLDSTSDMKEWYKEQGFSYEGYCGRKCHGTVTSYESITLQNPYNIVPLSDDIWSALIAYDKEVYPYCRERALRQWFCGSDRYTVVALLGKSVVGYANYHRKSENRFNIRTLNADDDVIAETLLLNLLKNMPIGTVVSFVLLRDKPVTKYLSDFQRSKHVRYRLFTNKKMSDIQSDKIYFAPTHMI